MIKSIMTLDEHGHPLLMPFDLRDPVLIDGYREGTITAITVHPEGLEFGVSWWSNGEPHSGWFPSWRLSRPK